jgi:recombination protein RecR
MEHIDRLSKLLNDLPGIGPRQAKRLAYALITKPREYAEELSAIIKEVRNETANCTSCMRFINKRSLVDGVCSICRDTHRDHSLLMIVSRDIDLQSMDRSGFYKGFYFVLGGTVPLLEKNPEAFIRLRELRTHVANKPKLSEIILAYSQTPEGEHTARILEETLREETSEVKITHLGRGLSTGTELEYSDNETLRNALRNRA